MADRRAAVQLLVDGGLSVHRACTLIHRSTFRYVAHPADDQALLTQLNELVARHPRSGYRRISALLNQTGRVKQKRVRRLWRLHHLHVRRIVRKRMRHARPERMQAAYPGPIWAYDVVEDA